MKLSIRFVALLFLSLLSVRFAERIIDLFETSKPLSVPILLQNIMNKQSVKFIMEYFSTVEM